MKSVFPLQSFISTSPREEKKGASNATAVSLQGYPLGNAPSCYLTHQSLTLQRIHCPKIISSATLWHVKIRNIPLLRARLRMWEHSGSRKETIGAHGEVLKKLAWGRPEQGLRDFTERSLKH